MFLEVDEDFIEHPKSVRLCRALQNPIGWAYVIKLWRWCTKFQKDGDLSGYDPAEIECALGWTLDEGVLYGALVKCGFIDVVTGVGACVHDWDKHQGKWIKKLEKDRNDAKERRAAGRRQSDRADETAPTHLHDLATTDKQGEFPGVGRRSVDVRPTFDRHRPSVGDSLAKPGVAEQSKAEIPPRPPRGGEGLVGQRARTRRPTPPPEYPPDFERIWAETGRSGNKFPALDAWKKHGQPSADAVIAGWKLAEQHDRRWPRCVPNLSSWLNARGWEDDPRLSRAGPGPPPSAPWRPPDPPTASYHRPVDRSGGPCKAHLLGLSDYLESCDRNCPSHGDPVEPIELADAGRA